MAHLAAHPRRLRPVLWLALAMTLAAGPSGLLPGVRTAVAVAAGPAPVVTATPPSGYAPLTVDFRIDGAEGATTTWTYGDGSSAATVAPGEAIPSHRYTAEGSFAVTVEVLVDGQPAPAPEPVTITVGHNPDAPLAALTASAGLSAVGRTVTFTSTSTGAIESLRWDFGDGGAASGSGPVAHRYASAGTYTVVLTATGVGLESTAKATVKVLGAWSGSVNLFRSAAFVKQYRSSWCTAAAVQFMRNLSLRLASRSSTLQQRIMSYERSVDTLTDSRGSDPRGMARALVRFGAGDTYADRSYSSLRRAVEAAARRIRITGKPVAVFVWGGTHVWTMHGFRATADPAFTTSNVVTHIIVSGPLGGPRDPVNKTIALANLGGDYGFRQYWLRDGWLGWYRRWVVVSP